MKKILLTAPIHPDGIKILEERYEVIISPNEDKETLMKFCKDVDGIIVRLADIGKDIIDSAQSLKIIAKHGAGVDNVDVTYATEKGICVVNTGNANSLSVAEHTIAGMLSILKRVTIIDNAVRNDNWYIKNDNKSLNYTGKTLGLIGVGSIGLEVARMASNGFMMKVIAYDPYANIEMVTENGVEIINDLKEIFKVADVISIHTPLTDETRGLINRELLELLKPTAVFVNFARGEIVDEEHLIEILKKKRIFGAALDAFIQEPLPKDSPYYSLENVILSPHAGTFTDDCRSKMAQYLAEDIIQFFEGQNPIRLVNKELV